MNADLTSVTPPEERGAQPAPAAGPSDPSPRASPIRRNLVASLVGQAWVAVVQLAFIPLYVRLLGIEAYGLIGFYAFLQTSLQLFDMGLTPTMSRELARITGTPDRGTEAHTLVWTVEAIYLGIGVVIGIALFACSPLIALHWLKPSGLSTAVVETCLRTMGVVAALQWPLSLYQAGLNGLQQQRAMNMVKATFSTLAAGGAVVLMLVVGRSITLFFAWQAFIAGAHVVATRFVLKRRLPPATGDVVFDRAVLHGIRRFAGGMTGIMVTALAMTQLDKAILSRMLPLADFGYYMLASVVSTGIWVIVAPLFNLFFPYFTTLATSNQVDRLRQAYHLATQLMATLVLPLGLTLSLLSREVLFVWTGDETAAARTAGILSILVLGSMINGLMNVPYALQLAYGWTRIGLVVNAVLLSLLLPAIVLFTQQRGAIGAAGAWLLLNLVYLASAVPLTHRRVLHGEAGRWLFGDILPSLAAALLPPILAHWLVLGRSIPRWSMAGLLVSVGALSVAAAASVASQIRPRIVASLRAI